MKTVTLSDEAYARLEAAKQQPDESDSDVLLRIFQSRPAAELGNNRWHQFACATEEERAEIARIETLIEQEFEQIAPEDWK